MVRGYPSRSRVLLCAALAACNIDDLAGEFFLDSPTPTTGDAGSSSTGPAAFDASSSGGASDPAGASADATADTSTADADSTSTSDPASSSEATDTSTGGPTPICGDGVIDPPEECEDPGDIHCFNCYRDRYVFVTSEVVNGHFVADTHNIDYWCAHLAAVAGLQGPFELRFKAWISTSEESAADRLFHSPGRYLLVNDLVFAESWDDLVAGNILNPLMVDENSQTNNVNTWTDTRPDGTATLPDGGNHCSDWTEGGILSRAYFGDSAAVDANWTLVLDPQLSPVPCGAAAALYCFESL